MASLDQSSSEPPSKHVESNRAELPDKLKADIEELSCPDLAGVRVHTNSSEPARLDAMAYAQGDEIHLGPGQEKHLPHETWHVVQEHRGRVSTTGQGPRKIVVNDDKSLEQEADAMGAQADAIPKERRRAEDE